MAGDGGGGVAAGQAGVGAAGAGGGAGTGGVAVPLGGAGGEGGQGGVAGEGLGGGTAGAAATGTAGTADTGAAGAGATGAAGTGGAAGDAGGSGGAAGDTGAAGAGGRGGEGGTGGRGGGCGICPACTHCANGACSPDVGSMWKVVCVRATIAQTKPTGDPWDVGLGTLAAPDPQCAFWLGNATAAETSTLSNTFTPAWNESITPGSRFSVGLLSSQTNPWSIRVTDDDQTAGAEAICSISPALDAAAFVSGSATFSAGSCSTLEIALDCVAP